ncbi:MAG: transporter substrate-binding domain-containing protein [Magnetospirillum sp.]|nr:transporter substrate-binding domain-containing protein [Magnetospirillum sp.]
MRPIATIPLALALALAQVRPAAAAEIVMAIGLSLEPYIFVDEERGLEYDIVKGALAQAGHTMKTRFMAFGRVSKELEAGMVDAAMTMRANSGVPAHYSASHIAYRNYAITLAKNNLRIAGVEDLAGKAVVAFQNASRYLGPAYAAAVSGNPRYREEARQAVQPTLLFLDRTEVVIADRHIFAWFANSPEVMGKADTRQQVRMHPIFLPTEYTVAFRDPHLRDDFDRGLKALRASGEYGRIVERYSRFLAEETALNR